MPTHAATLTKQALKSDWRCRCCRKLLGRHDGRSLFLKSSRGPSYEAALPATAVCRCCGRLNELAPTA